MQPENSSCQQTSLEKVRLQLRLPEQAAIGRLDDLECPQCGHKAVSVWFTHPAANIYRTWFGCSHCNFITRAQNSTRPPFFSEARVRQDLEERDLVALESSVFKAPSAGELDTSGAFQKFKAPKPAG
jgi:hypothetical protein